MTIIVVFLGIVEVVITVALPFTDISIQSKLVYFIIGFPVLCAIGFFIVLYFRPKNFYSPQDFRSDETYLATQQITAKEETEALRLISQDIKSFEEKKNQEQEEDINKTEYLPSFFDNLSDEICFYLLKTVNKPLVYTDHVKILTTELSALIKNQVTDQVLKAFEEKNVSKDMVSIVSRLVERYFARGYFFGFILNLDMSVIDVDVSDAKIIIKIKPEYLRQISERLLLSVSENADKTNEGHS